MRRARSILLASLGLTLIASAAQALDTDGDGVDDALDNCRLRANRVQLDTDRDGFGNRCDVDFDQSGVANGRDVRHFTRLLRKHDPNADIDENGSVDWNDVIASIGLWGQEPGPGQEFEDDDGDGVPTLADACPDSIGGGSLREGCANADLALRAADLIAAPTALAIRSVFSEIPSLPSHLDDVAESVEDAARIFEDAAVFLSQGRTCVGARLADTGVSRLGDARSRYRDLLPLTAAEIGRSHDRPGGIPGEDWEDANEFSGEMLPFWIAEQSFDQGVEAASQAAEEMNAVCDATVSSPALSGVIAFVDPQNRILGLDSGERLGLAAEYEVATNSAGQAVSLGPGVEIEAQGVGFTDGSVMVQQVTPIGERLVELYQVSTCLRLLIAPYQLSPTYSGQPKEVHDARSYRRTGFSTLSLEPGMALGISDAGCPESEDVRLNSVYGGRLVIRVGDESATLTQFLQRGDLVDIPGGIPAFSTVTIELTTRRKDCNIFGDRDDCTATQDLLTETHEGVMRSRGAYCEVDYAQTEFALEDVPSNLFAVTHPSFLTVLEGPGRDNPTSHFVGLGWRVRNGTHGDHLEEIRIGDDFAIFKGDFRDAWDNDPRWAGNTLSVLGLPRDPDGVIERPGMVWPSLRGTQNGGPFRYSCRPPRVSRDVVGFCSGHGNAFHELPLAIANISQGPSGSFSHSNAEAWDLPATLDTPVLSSRPGRVIWTRETEGDTCDPDVDDPGDPQCAGNGVVIRHSDGTDSKYWHLGKNKVGVSKNVEVPRGAMLGLSGNTGYSTGPHLHHQLDFSGTNNRVNGWFHLWKFSDGLFKEKNCYEPVKGDFLLREGF